METNINSLKQRIEEELIHNLDSPIDKLSLVVDNGYGFGYLAEGYTEDEIIEALESFGFIYESTLPAANKVIMMFRK